MISYMYYRACTQWAPAILLRRLLLFSQFDLYTKHPTNEKRFRVRRTPVVCRLLAAQTPKQEKVSCCTEVNRGYLAAAAVYVYFPKRKMKHYNVLP
jgi:hypothetical protein